MTTLQDATDYLNYPFGCKLCADGWRMAKLRPVLPVDQKNKAHEDREYDVKVLWCKPSGNSDMRKIREAARQAKAIG